MGSSKEIGLKLKATAEAAIQSIGFGYDIAQDLRLKYFKGSRLIVIDDDQVRDIIIPGGILIPNVSKQINCDKGERIRLSSDGLSFQKVSIHQPTTLSVTLSVPYRENIFLGALPIANFRKGNDLYGNF